MPGAPIAQNGASEGTLAQEWHTEKASSTAPNVCIECRRPADRARGWRGYLVPDELERVALYCPSCAAREFGSSSA